MKGFKQFVLRGNVVDLAVAVVIGAAFTAVITALVSDFITPLIAAIMGKQSFSMLYFTLHHAKFVYGGFLSAVLSFLIVATVVYFAVVGGIPAALSQMTELGVWSVGLAGESSQSLYDLPLGEGPIALVVGSEEKGLAPLVRRRCDAVVSIPQHGSLPSLNVGVAGAVAAFEVARQRSIGRA